MTRREPKPTRTYTLVPYATLCRSCLPNDRAAERQIARIYYRFGLNARQIEILSRAAPKRDYYCQWRRGNRLFELGLGDVALAFTAASSKSDQLRIDELVAKHGTPALDRKSVV